MTVSEQGFWISLIIFTLAVYYIARWLGNKYQRFFKSIYVNAGTAVFALFFVMTLIDLERLFIGSASTTSMLFRHWPFYAMAFSAWALVFSIRDIYKG